MRSGSPLKTRTCFSSTDRMGMAHVELLRGCDGAPTRHIVHLSLRLPEIKDETKGPSPRSLTQTTTRSVQTQGAALLKTASERQHFLSIANLHICAAL